MFIGTGYTGKGAGYIGKGTGCTGKGTGYTGRGTGCPGRGTGYTGIGNGYTGLPSLQSLTPCLPVQDFHSDGLDLISHFLLASAASQFAQTPTEQSDK